MQWLRILLLAGLLGLAPVSGSAQPAGEKAASPAPESAVQETRTPAPAGTNYTLKDRQAYQKRVGADLEEFQQRLNNLNEKPITMVSQRRMKVRAVVGLQQRVLTARNQLADLEKANDQEWGGLKSGIDKTMKDLKRSFDQTEAAFH